MVSNVVAVGGRSFAIGGLVIVALLIPAPMNWVDVVGGNLVDIALDINEVESRIVIRFCGGLNIHPHE